MNQPKMIIADTDEKYLNPLQLKFVEEFFDQIDLEVITDQAYFLQLFSTPQQADVLIVSESLYHEGLQRHNLQHIFLLSEQGQQGDEDPVDQGVTKIHKYTSCKEIFDEVVWKSGIKVGSVEKNETKVIMMYSACGGTGKTTLALGVSACMTKNYKKVLYVHAGYLPSFGRYLKNQSPLSADTAIKFGKSSPRLYQEISHVIRREGFHYLPPFASAIMSQGIAFSSYLALIESAKESKEYDYIIVDTDAVYTEDQAAIMNLANKVMIVTEQTNTAVYATNLLAANLSGIGTEKFVFICNKFDREQNNALLSEAMNLKFVTSGLVDCLANCDQLTCDELSKSTAIQKMSILAL